MALTGDIFFVFFHVTPLVFVVPKDGPKIFPYILLKLFYSSRIVFYNYFSITFPLGLRSLIVALPGDISLFSFMPRILCSDETFTL